jgi:hypothetical protein
LVALLPGANLGVDPILSLDNTWKMDFRRMWKLLNELHIR